MGIIAHLAYTGSLLPENSEACLKSMTVILNLIEEGQAQGEIREDISALMLRHMIIGTLEHVSTY